MSSEKIGSVQNLFPYLEQPEKFPRLPVPELQASLDRYLRTVKAITSPQEYENTSRLVTEFFNSSESKRLHSKLYQLDEQSPTSWLEGLWDTMYLELRCPVMVHVSPYYAIASDPRRADQVLRAAALIASSVRFHDLIINKGLSPDPGLDMSQYGKLLGSCRIPVSGRDTYSESIHGNTVVIACNNQFYEVRCRDQNGLVIPEEELVVHLRSIVIDAYSTKQVTPVGVFTADDRDKWAAARKVLAKEPENASSLKAIEDALLVICLDDTNQYNLTDVSQMLLHGNGRNRWFDKSVQIMIGKGGEAGILMEHTRFDGHSILKFTDFIFHDSVVRDIPTPNENIAPVLGKLNWKITPEIEILVEESSERVDELIGSVDTYVLEFEDWGKGLIKNFKVSPDAFVQIAYQLAYYRMRGTHGSTYESCNMKRFYHGRTTCIRSCTLEANAFSKIACDANATKEQKLAALKVAIDRHVIISNEARDGNDVDRPLFGMYHMARFEQQKFPNRSIPSIYFDPVYARMKTDMLSTSNSSGTPALTMFGFGPTSSTGFGLGYVIAEEYIHVDVTSFTREAKQYADHLRQALIDLAALFE